MFCTTECWICEDKKCKHYVSKQELYFENIDLKNNWNELKKWLEEDNYKVFEEIWVNTQEVLDKMQELENRKV